MTRALLALVLLTVGALGCRAPADAPLPCATDASCPGGYHCSVQGICTGDVPCQADVDCCLAERCTKGICRRRSMCSSSAPCGGPASRCLSGMCVPLSCGVAADCPTGTPCVMGRCSKFTPCEGHCPGGQACAPLLNRCVAQHGAGAGVDCAAGTLALLSNEHDHFLEGCGEIPQEVLCRPLPSLPAGDLGWPSILLDRGDHLALVARDRSYGDIVLVRHSRAPPYAAGSVAVLAGLPSQAPVVGDPLGPRAGIAEPGPDVGRVFDAVAISAGRIALAWRDDTADALGYLSLSGDGQIAAHQIISGGGVGEAIALDTAGDVPMLAVFTPAPALGGTASLRLLTAKTSTPAAASDWQVELIAQQVVKAPSPPCGGSCASPQVCARTATVGAAGDDQCVLATTDCALCLPSQVCSAGFCLERHLPEPAFDRLPAGRGVHLDLLRLADGPHIAAYSRSAGDLAFFHPQPDGSHQVRIVDGDDVPGGSSDLGRFVRLLPAPGGGVEAYCQDASGGRLLRIRPGPPLEVLVIDDGIRTDGHHRVGADVAVASAGSSAVVLAYQDTRRGQSIIAALGQDGTLGARIELTSDGAGGFSPTVVQLGPKALVVGAASLRFDGKAVLRTTVELRSVVMSGL